MLTYITSRILIMIPTLLGVLSVTFLLAQCMPGGPVEALLASTRGQSATGAQRLAELDPARIAQIKAIYGFDEPAGKRYLKTVAHFARFDFGRSLKTNQGVFALIMEKLPVTVSLGLWSSLAAYLVSIPLGVAKAVRAGSRFDASTTVLIILGFSIPGFVLGVLLIVIFAGGSFLNWFPLRGLLSDNWSELNWTARILDYLWHLVLPVTCLALGSIASLTVLTRNAVLEEIGKQYVLVARAKGLPDRAVLYRHILRNALVPLVTGLPAAVVAVFFGGSLLIETLFSLDGVGLLSYEALVRRDYPVVLAGVYLSTLFGLVAKLLADLAYISVDARIQLGRRVQ